jgi:hypothetical protein
MSKRRTPQEEAAAADYYDAHMNDWEESSEPVPVPPGEKPKGVGSVVTVRFQADEAALLRRVAEREGRTQSDTIRRAVRAYATGGETVIRIDVVERRGVRVLPLSRSLRPPLVPV